MKYINFFKFFPLVLALQIYAPESRSSSVGTSDDLLESQGAPSLKLTGENQKDLYLVVGSTRENSNFGLLADSILGIKHTDMTHQKTFAGQAVTMDLEESVIKEASHIQGDARIFDFASLYNIKAVLLERLPTMAPPSSSNGDSDIAAIELPTNYMGSCIEQIAKAMNPGATMDIEWLPCMTLLLGSPSDLLELPFDLEALVKKNPFHAFLDTIQVLHSVFILGGDFANITIFPEEKRSKVWAMVEKLMTQISFYIKQGATDSLKQMQRQLYSEAKILEFMIRSGGTALLDLPNQAQADEIITALQQPIFAEFSEDVIGKNILLDSVQSTGIVYDVFSCLERSFFNFIIKDIAAAQNAPYVKEYMESIGFENVSIKKGTNPHNGRKNVWMINALKT